MFRRYNQVPITAPEVNKYVDIKPEVAEYRDSYMYVSCTVSYIMTAILNFKMADKLTYIQIRLYNYVWNPLASQTLCITTILTIQSCSEYHLIYP